MLMLADSIVERKVRNAAHRGFVRPVLSAEMSLSFLGIERLFEKAHR